MIQAAQHIIRKKNGKLTQVWLSEEYVVSTCGVSAEYLMKKRSVCKSWNYIVITGVRYYEYYSIPDKAPACYRSKLPTFDELIEAIEPAAERDNDYNSTFNMALGDADRYTYIYKSEPAERRDKLAAAASIVEATVAYITATSYNTRRSDIFERMAALAEANNITYLPHNYRRIKEKVMNRLSGQPIGDVIKAPRSGNDNAAKFRYDDQISEWIYQLASNPRNFSDAYICRQVQQLCSLSGKPAPSTETIRAKLNERSTLYLTSVERHGSGTREAAAYEAYIPIARAPFAGDCWQIDATRVNMIAHERDITAPDGVTRKVLANLMVCAVRDVHSGSCLGYSFDYAESFLMYFNAIKMAVQSSGYLPYELVTDKFPGHNKAEAVALIDTLKMYGVKITTSHKATGKAQVERWFNTMQQIEMQGNDYYYGEGIRSTRAHAHPSPDHLERMRKRAKSEAFNLQDVIDMYSGMIEAHNQRNYSEYSRKLKHLNDSPAGIHSASEKPNAIAVTDRQINHIFGAKTDVKIAGNGIFKVTLRHIDHYYSIADYNIVEQNARVCVSYDPSDMSSVCIYKRLPGTTWLQFLARCELFEQPMVYGPQAEMNRLAEAKKQAKEFNEKRAARLAKLKGEADEIEDIYEAEEAVLMGQHTMKKAACGYEDIELNISQSIFSQVRNNNKNY